MKAIIIERRKDDSKINAVYSCERLKAAEEQWENVVKNFNETSKYCKFELYHIPEGKEELFDFLLGEKTYKAYANISKLKDKIDDVGESIESLSTDIYDLQNVLEVIKNEVKNISKDDE